jgi:hypothetical protein
MWASTARFVSIKGKMRFMNPFVWGKQPQYGTSLDHGRDVVGYFKQFAPNGTPDAAEVRPLSGQLGRGT